MNYANTASPEKREEYWMKAEGISLDSCNKVREYEEIQRRNS